ncbi:MAG: S8 family serine peptidase [Tepidiformaceae bacterium]
MMLKILGQSRVRFALAAVAFALMAPAIFASDARGQPDPAAELAGHVAAGRLDAAVYQSIIDTGSAEGIIVFDEQGPLARAATARAARGLPVNDAAIINQLANDYAAIKTQARAQTGNIAELRDYEHFGLQFVRFQNAASLAALLRSPQVSGVSENAAHKPTLGQSLPLINQPAVAAGGYTGTGKSIAIIDTGVNYTHAAFGSCTAPGVPVGCKVVYAQDFAPSDGQLDDNGHGTNVSGIAIGVAPDGKILGLDVFRRNIFGSFSAYTSDIVAALDWTLANRLTYNIASANMSLGDGTYQTSQCISNNPYLSSITNLRAAGILVAVAAGNEGAGGAGLSSPACTPGVISVGAVYDAPRSNANWGDCTDTGIVADKVVCWSQYASYLSLLAPGSSIDAAGLNGYSGTSMAAPHAAGAIAVLAAALPTANAAALEAALTGGGPGILDIRNGVTKNRLDVCAAVAALLGTAGCGSPPPPPPAGCYQLSLSNAGAGTATATPSNSTGCDPGQYIDGQAITITATANAGSTFTSWAATAGSPLASTDNPLSYTMAASPATVTATFTGDPAPSCYALTRFTAGSGSGSTSASPSNSSGCLTGQYVDGQAITLTATAAAGSTFTSWSATAGTVASPGTPVTAYTMAASAATVTATFTANPAGPVLYLSLKGSATLSGAGAVANEDIVRWNGSTYEMFFDGSDVGLTDFTLDAFDIIPGGAILLSFTGSGTIPGISGTVDDSDIVKFTPTSTGPTTAGSFSMFFDGSDIGLTLSAEDIDAISYDGANLYLSAAGSFSVSGGLSGADHDIFVCKGLVPGDITSCGGGLATYFDGDDVGLTDYQEDIDAFAIGSDGALYFSTSGSVSVTGVSGANEDVFKCTPTATGAATSCSPFAMHFDGSTKGISTSNDISDIDFGP